LKTLKKYLSLGQPIFDLKTSTLTLQINFLRWQLKCGIQTDKLKIFTLLKWNQNQIWKTQRN